MLQARAQTMTSVIDAVTEQSIIGTDVDGVVRVWNPGAERMLGHPRADVVRRRSITDFHLPEELAEAGGGLAALVRTAQEQGSDVRDWTYVAADGEERTVSVAVTPRTDDRGVHAGWNFVGTDMTEVRATERMKDQFVSLISHELRTPLTSILGYLELVLDDPELGEEPRQYLGTVERNAQRLLRLVGDLLSPRRWTPAGSACSRRTSTWWASSGRRRRPSGSLPRRPVSRSSSTCPTAAWWCTATPSGWDRPATTWRSEEHTSELQSRQYLVCCLLLEKKKSSERPLIIFMTAISAYEYFSH